MNDTIQAYRDWTMDVYEHKNGGWCADVWYSGRPGSWRIDAVHRRKTAIALARDQIDNLIERRRNGEEIFLEKANEAGEPQ